MPPEENDSLTLLRELLLGIVHQDLVQFEPQRHNDLLVLAIVQVLLAVLQVQLLVPLIDLLDLPSYQLGIDCHQSAY